MVVNVYKERDLGEDVNKHLKILRAVEKVDTNGFMRFIIRGTELKCRLVILSCAEQQLGINWCIMFNSGQYSLGRVQRRLQGC